VLLGAGASQPLGFSSTCQLSNAVLLELRRMDRYARDDDADAREISADQPRPMERLIDIIRGAGSSNFEDDMHALESLMTLAPLNAMERVFLKYYGRTRPRPPIADILAVSAPHPGLSDRDVLEPLMRCLVSTVRAELEKAEAVAVGAALDPLAALFGKLAERFHLVFHSFNYDESARVAAERVLGPLEDGFVDVGEYARFDVQHFLNAGPPRYSHLHGSLRYRVPMTEARTDALPSYEVVKFARGSEIPKGFVDLQEARTQAGDFMMIGSIVTGLHKADKTRTEPYGGYAYALERDLYASPHILIVGYGGGDTYVNMQLIRARRYHAAAWKPAVISYGLPDANAITYALWGVLCGVPQAKFSTALGRLRDEGGEGRVGDLFVDIGGFLRRPDQGTNLVNALL
jgi:hypothetical protein